MNTSAGGCERHRLQWTRKCRKRTRTCTCTVGTSVSNRNRSRNRIRVGNRKTVNRCNPVGRSIPARRWPLRTWCSDRKGWGSIVLLESFNRWNRNEPITSHYIRSKRLNMIDQWIFKYQNIQDFGSNPVVREKVLPAHRKMSRWALEYSTNMKVKSDAHNTGFRVMVLAIRDVRKLAQVIIRCYAVKCQQHNTYVDPFDDKTQTDRRYDVLDKSTPQCDFWAYSPRCDRIDLRIRLRSCNFGMPSSLDSLDWLKGNHRVNTAVADRYYFFFFFCCV